MPRHTVTFTADEVAVAARLAGYQTTQVTEADDQVDGHVQVTPDIHIQVSAGFLSVVRECPDGQFEFSMPFDGPDQVKDALHRVTELAKL